MTFTIHAPQIIYLALTIIGAVYTISKHGQPKTGKYDAVSSTISNAIIMLLLYWGGFFG